MLAEFALVSSKSFSAMGTFVIKKIRNKAGKSYNKTDYYQGTEKIARKHNDKSNNHKQISQIPGLFIIQSYRLPINKIIFLIIASRIFFFNNK